MRAPFAAGIACAVVTSATVPAAAQVECGEDGPWRVALSAGLGVAAGAAGALTSSGIISAADDTKDYSFAIGALAGIGVTAGLSGIYAIYDGSTGCEMANSGTLGVVWSVPIVMIILGAALPIAVWGASDDVVAPPPEDMMMTQGLSWGFEF